MIQPFNFCNDVLFLNVIVTSASSYWRKGILAFLTSDLPIFALGTPCCESPLSPETGSIESANRFRELAGKQ